MHHFGQVFKTCSQSEASRNASFDNGDGFSHRFSSTLVLLVHCFDCAVLLHSASPKQTLYTSKRFDLENAKLRRSQ